jgi:hypothetical protein
MYGKSVLVLKSWMRLSKALEATMGRHFTSSIVTGIRFDPRTLSELDQNWLYSGKQVRKAVEM